MSLDIPVFDLKPLKKQFYYFFATALLILITSLLVVYTVGADLLQNIHVFNRSNNLIFLGTATVFTIISGQQNKRGLKAIQQADDITKRIALYPGFYKRKLIWAAVALLVTGLLWVFSGSKFLFYFFVFHFLLSFIFIPKKKIISRELNVQEIEFI